MKFLIAGLGNIGAEYDDTRHNIGFNVLNQLAHDLEAPFRLDHFAHVSSAAYKGKKLILIKPTTYMNLSGKAVRYWLQKAEVPPENLLVVLDDLALDFGMQRLRPSGSAGGHNGLKNIDELLAHNNYARLRIGIGDNFRKGQQIDFVLGKWTKKELETLPENIERASETVKSFVAIGLQLTMTAFNKKI